MGVAVVRIDTGSQAFDIPLGNGPAQITDGLNGWGTVARADRVALTEWTGPNPIAQSVPCLLDGFAERTSVQPELDRILALAFTPDGTEPESFIATGPIHLSGLRWVLAGVDLDSSPEGCVRRRGDLVLIRQALTLQLLQRVEPDALTIQPRAAKAKGGGGARIYTVKGSKETLKTIAQAKLGDAKRAKEIGKLNGISDVMKKLAKGRKIRLPAK